MNVDKYFIEIAKEFLEKEGGSCGSWDELARLLQKVYEDACAEERITRDEEHIVLATMNSCGEQ